jgi:hypothetical protein
MVQHGLAKRVVNRMTKIKPIMTSQEIVRLFFSPDIHEERWVNVKDLTGETLDHAKTIFRARKREVKRWR